MPLSLFFVRADRNIRSNRSLGLLLTLPKFFKLLKFPIISIGRVRNFRNPPSVVSATSETHKRSYPLYLPRLCRGHIPRRGGGLGVGQA